MARASPRCPAWRGLVPDLATDLVHRSRRPLHRVKGIETDDRLGTVTADRAGDPGAAVSRDLGDAPAASASKPSEEALDRGPITTVSRPDQATGVVVNDHHQVTLTTAVGDLVDPDPAQVGEYQAGLDQARGDPLQDVADAPPRDPHQVLDRRLRTLHGQPCDLLLEGPREPRPVPGPRHPLHHHPMLGAAHPTHLRFHPSPPAPDIQGSPSSRTAGRVVPRAGPSTPTAARPSTPRRLHPTDDDIGLLTDIKDLDVAEHQSTAPYSVSAHVEPLLRITCLNTK